MVCASPISRARNGCRAGYHFFGQPMSKCRFSLPRAVISERQLCHLHRRPESLSCPSILEGSAATGLCRLRSPSAQGRRRSNRLCHERRHVGSLSGWPVEHGKTLRPANRKSGSGNFYLKPNGVLYIIGQDAGIATTDRFVAERPRVDFATQSGPEAQRKDQKVAHEGEEDDAICRVRAKH
jgi:hypothetical protein